MKNKPKKWINIEGRFNLAVVQYSDYQLIVGGLKPGNVVDLIGEPSNKYDKKAIRVEYKGVSIGYIPRGTIYQSELWNYHNKNAKSIGIVTAFNKNNPTWCMITIQCKRTRIKSDSMIEESEVKFA